jgi:hypothetical protein
MPEGQQLCADSHLSVPLNAGFFVAVNSAGIPEVLCRSGLAGSGTDVFANWSCCLPVRINGTYRTLIMCVVYQAQIQVPNAPGAAAGVNMVVKEISEVGHMFEVINDVGRNCRCRVSRVTESNAGHRSPIRREIARVGR